MDEINNNDSHLRAKLFDLIEEQEKWQRMKDEAMGADTIDALQGKIKSIQDTVAHHEDIIERCHKAGKSYLFPQKTEHSWYYNSPEYIPSGDERDDWDTEYVIYGGDMYLPELVVSVKHSEKRVSIWQEEITKLEQRVIKITIAQEQLTQVTQDIADINEQIKNAAMSQPSEPLVEESSDKVEKASTPKINMGTTKLYRIIDNLSLEICQDKFNYIIINSAKKQRALLEILDSPNHFNHKHFTHKELANELNNLQQRFTFTKTDVDKAYQNINRIKK